MGAQGVGAPVPVSSVMHAQTFRRWYQASVLELFEGGGCRAAAGHAVRGTADRAGTFTLEGLRRRCGPISVSTRSFIACPSV